MDRAGAVDGEAVVSVEVERAPAEEGDACVLCEEPIAEGDDVVTLATSLTPDECVAVCLRCARAVGNAANRG